MKGGEGQDVRKRAIKQDVCLARYPLRRTSSRLLYRDDGTGAKGNLLATKSSCKERGNLYAALR